jgi:two-component system sensor histidine kinase AgrC
MSEVLWMFCIYSGSFLALLANGFFLYQLCGPFAELRRGRGWKALLFLTFTGSSGMVIWIGDPNLLYTLPVYFLLFLLCTKGDLVGRLAVCVIFFCLEMSVCALLDSYMQGFNDYGLWDVYDITTRLARPLIFGALWLLRRRFPAEQVRLSRRLWQVVLGLAAMPLCALAAVVLLTVQKHESAAVNTLALNQGLVVLPFVLLTSVVLLYAVRILADHERLERASQLAGLREVYYQGLRQQERQVRTLRHDLRNHLTVIRGLLESGETQNTIGYLDQIAGSPAFRGTKRLCENEAANAVLSAKAEAMEREGLGLELAVSLPAELAVEDVDLCALLGNALDNAMEGARGAGGGTVTVRCRADKGLLMLRVLNPAESQIRPDLATTKTDKLAHGFGIPGMREIAERYGGTLEAGAREGVFELLVCLPLPEGREPPSSDGPRSV